VLPESLISAEKVSLMNACLSTDPYRGVTLARTRTHEGVVYKSA
jgi:hypothetical protein